MTNRSTSRFLFLIVLVLLITNIIMLFLFVIPAGNAHHEKRTQDNSLAPILKDSVGFSEKQLQEYTDLRITERAQLKDYFTNMRSVKERFYSSVYTPQPDSVTMALADSIGSIQRNIDLHMRQYFMKVRLLSTPEQMPAFDSAIAKTVNRMIGRQGRNKNSQIKTQNK